MTEEFIRKSILVHGDKYDYSKTEYVNAKTKVVIICKEHGEFLQIPGSHRQGCGCRKCGFISTQYKRTMQNKEFIENAILVHGDKYDYSKTEYINNLKEVIIICRIHGEFSQLPKTHKRGADCIDCSLITRGNKRTKTTEQFIEEAKIIHGNKYDYSKSEYKKSIQNIIIICKEHGEFLQTAQGHLGGSGCKMCANKMIGDKLKKTTEQFIKEAKLIHGDKYDYSKVEYKTNGEKIVITCPIHGDFEQRPSGHLRGRRCTICYSQFKSNTEEFIEKAKKVHVNKYDYSKTKYEYSNMNIIIICKIHGEFLQTPNHHLTGAGCKSTIFTTDEFIQKAKEIHGDKYDYSKSIYVKMSDKVIITCQIHGDFQQTPSNHITHQQDCQKCARKCYSKCQIKWLDFISSYNQIKIQHAENEGEYIIPTTKYSADGYCKETNTIYEFHGDFWHGNPKIYHPIDINPISNKTFQELYQRTLDREQEIKNLGYNLIVIWESDWNKLNKSIKIIQTRFRNKKYYSTNSKFSSSDEDEGEGGQEMISI